MMDTLNQWVQKTFRNIELFDTPKTKTVLKNGAPIKITHQPNKIEVELSLGLLSTDNLKDWTRIVFHLAPLGTIVDEIDETFYNDMILLLHKELTKLLLDASTRTMAEKFINILERRDKERWNSNNRKETTVNVKDNDIHLTFTVKD